nr:MAG TPA: peptidase [Caudoviricetes sp.]
MFIKDMTTAVNETYFGKSKELEIIEKSFDKAIQSKDKIDASSLGIVAKQLQKKFGFDNVSIGIDKTPGLNAYTYIDIADIKKMKIKTSEGYKALPGNTCSILVVFSPAMLSGVLSGKELTAITLHEIGHQFASKRILNSSSLRYMASYIRGLSELDKIIRIASQETNSIADMFMMIRRVISKLTEDAVFAIKYVINTLILLKDILKTPTLKDTYNLIGDSTKFNRIINYINNFDKVKKPIRVHDMEEEMADSFATIYGYGPELASALTKIEASDIDDEFDPYDNSFYNLYIYIPIYTLLSYICTSDSGIAIQTSRRVYAQLLTLRKEMNDIKTDAKTKKRILADIDKLEKVYGKYIDERIEAAERNKVKSATDRYNEEFWNRVLTNKRDNELFSYNKLGELLK